jgi:hypothetical protein
MCLRMAGTGWLHLEQLVAPLYQLPSPASVVFVSSTDRVAHAASSLAGNKNKNTICGVVLFNYIDVDVG